MKVDVRFRIVRMGKTYTYPYETSAIEYSIDGGEKWYNVNFTPFEDRAPSELIQRAFAPEIELKRGQLLTFEEDGNND